VDDTKRGRRARSKVVHGDGPNNHPRIAPVDPNIG
jgi:hypothetical protein